MVCSTMQCISFFSHSNKSSKNSEESRVNSQRSRKKSQHFIHTPSLPPSSSLRLTPLFLLLLRLSRPPSRPVSHHLSSNHQSPIINHHTPHTTHHTPIPSYPIPPLPSLSLTPSTHKADCSMFRVL